MGIATPPLQEALPEAAIASALRWWRDAGIEVLVDETPRRWLAAAAPASASERTFAPLPKPAAAKAVHETLAAFTQWFMTEPDVPEGGSPRRRVGPSGDPASGLMILVDFPEPADVDEGHLFAGEIAPMFDKMLTALGRDRRGAYIASITPGRPPKGRIDDAALALLTPHVRRHVELVGPKQLWLMGAAASRAILGLSDREAHGKLHTVNLDACIIEAVVTAHPRFLTDRDKKARAWAEMQRLIAKDSA